MNSMYDDLGGIMGTLEAYEAEIDTMILNGSIETANIHLRNSLTYLRQCLSELSDAEFEVTTSPFDDDCTE
ncbi:MAG: hypothetical protein ACI4ET_10685 [Bilifractor sp.]